MPKCLPKTFKTVEIELMETFTYSNCRNHPNSYPFVALGGSAKLWTIGPSLFIGEISCCKSSPKTWEKSDILRGDILKQGSRLIRRPCVYHVSFFW